MRYCFFILAVFYSTSAYSWIPSVDMVFPCAQGQEVEWPNLKGESNSKINDAVRCKEMVILKIETNLENRSSNVVCKEQSKTSEEVYDMIIAKYNQGGYKDYIFTTLVDEIMVEDLACELAKNSDHMWPF